MEEKERLQAYDDGEKRAAGQLADKSAAVAKDAAGKVVGAASDAAKDAARGVTDGATRAALGVVNRAQDSLERKLEGGKKSSASQKKKTGEKKSSKTKRPTKFSSIARIAIVVVIVIVLGIAVAFALVGPGRINSLDKDDFVTSAQLEKAVDIDELSTAEFVYNGIAEKYKENSDEVEFRISYDATVKAGIKMSDVTFDVDNEAKVVRPHLPEVTVTNIHVQEDQLSYMPENPNSEIGEVLTICEQDVRDEAAEAKGFKTTAEENLMTVIEALTTPILKSKGYTLEWSVSREGEVGQ